MPTDSVIFDYGILSLKHIKGSLINQDLGFICLKDEVEKVEAKCTFLLILHFKHSNRSLHSQQFIPQRMQSENQIKIECEDALSYTQLTQEDLTISYSKDMSRVKFQEDSETKPMKPVEAIKKVEPTKKVPREITFSSFTNMSKLFDNCDENQSFQSVKDQEQENPRDLYEETVKIEDLTQRQNSFHSKRLQANQDQNSTRLTKPKANRTGNKSMSEARQNTITKFGEINQLNEKELKSRMRQFQQQIRLLTIHKNFAKSLLKKDPDNNKQIEETYETRQCPCCEKLITKLCFKCEHTKCKQKGRIEDCPRWKKQRLNAKMLMKLKKKKEEPKRHNRSREKQLRSGTKVKREEDANDYNNSEEEFSSNQWSDSSESEENNVPKLRNQDQRNKPEPKVMNFEKTMTDFPLDESKLFVDSDQQK